MSFIKIEPVRAIKLHGKTYRSAHQASLAYSDAAARQFYYNLRQSGRMPSNMTLQQWVEWSGPVKEKFYTRSHKIFTRYFNGG